MKPTPEPFTTQFSGKPLAPTGVATYLPSLTRLQVRMLGGLAVQSGWGGGGSSERHSGIHSQAMSIPPVHKISCEDNIPFNGCWEHLVQAETISVLLNSGLPAFGTGVAHSRHLFIQQLFLGHFPGAEHCHRCWGPSGE